MKISEADSLTPVQCTDAGTQTLVQSHLLRGETRNSFLASIQESVDKSVLYDSLVAQLSSSARYFVSLQDSVRVCGQTWFSDQESYFFFDESKLIQLQVVKKIVQQQPVFVTLPLIANIRYMIVVRDATTCIYRVETDVQDIINNVARPSDSPSPTVSQTSIMRRHISIPRKTLTTLSRRYPFFRRSLQRRRHPHPFHRPQLLPLQ